MGQRDETARHLEAETRSRKEQENLDSRTFQQQKRMQKNSQKEDDERRKSQEYLDNKEHSEWSVAMAKMAHAERPKPIIQANLRSTIPWLLSAMRSMLGRCRRRMTHGHQTSRPTWRTRCCSFSGRGNLQ